MGLGGVRAGGLAAVPGAKLSSAMHTSGRSGAARGFGGPAAALPHASMSALHFASVSGPTQLPHTPLQTETASGARGYGAPAHRGPLDRRTCDWQPFAASSQPDPSCDSCATRARRLRGCRRPQHGWAGPRGNDGSAAVSSWCAACGSLRRGLPLPCRHWPAPQGMQQLVGVPPGREHGHGRRQAVRRRRRRQPSPCPLPAARSLQVGSGAARRLHGGRGAA